jgi:hypothetical protein
MIDLTPTIHTLAEALGTPPPAPALAPGDQPGLPAPRLRAQIAALEQALRQHPDAVCGDSDLCPLIHRFADGLYTREIFIPKGTVLTGKIHRQAHPNFLMQGEVIVVTEAGGRQHLIAPLALISPPGTKRAVVALEDTVWITVHANPDNTRDLTVLEAQIIAPDYAASEALDAATPLTLEETL